MTLKRIKLLWRTDGERLPTTKFLDEVLASDQREEPPMRDASGNLVEVRVTKPWALHLLTADGSNAAVEDAETMKAPAEPGLVRLTPTGVEMLVERYVCFVVEKKHVTYFGALPTPFVTALMEFAPSDIPVVRAINTAPLVTMSGQVIDGVGLDRDTGLVHRIESCRPPANDSRPALQGQEEPRTRGSAPDIGATHFFPIRPNPDSRAGPTNSATVVARDIGDSLPMLKVERGG
jgi:hypothetical protein